ncbi:MAG: hypothetical protein KGR26_07245 [Cyanobacteria bacterium REEB65]|nr:hypothetical protein [Cyanobacteria bacterium REEB65]
MSSNARPKREIGSRGMGRHGNPLTHPDRVEDYEDPMISIRPSEVGAIEMSDEIVSKFVDLMIVKLRRRRIPFHWIARIFRVDTMVVHRRFHAIPEKTRRFYETAELG